ncbi:MAG: alpha/beta fold hydrolase [Thermomicrobiales bacterium]
MTQVKSIRRQLVHANGAELYCELRGEGPAVVFISGATGDAGHFDQLADQLAGEFTCVTYDRRGNSRSPKPPRWTQTSMDEQADDAAALIQALDLAPAAVFGTSGGAVILLNLLLRHPEVLRGAIVHEPPLLPVLPNAAEVTAMLQQMIEEHMARGGPPAAMEAFVREAAGDTAFEALDPALRERMLNNAEIFFGVELDAFVSYVPDAAELAAANVPVHVVAGRESRDNYYHDAAQWVANQVGSELREISGAHTPYFDRPEAMAEALRPILRDLVGEEIVMDKRSTHKLRQSPRVDRRRLLRSGGALAGAVALLRDPAAARAREEAQTLTLDVACDGGSLRLIRQNPTEAPGLPLAGDWFIFSGSIYPAGTIDAGLTGPTQAGSIGRWVCRGTFLADLATLEPGNPAVVTTVQFVLADGLSATAGNLGTAADAITTEGFEPQAGLDVIRVITGGYGQYAGAYGVMTATVREENDTLIPLAPDIAVPAPSFTFVFTFQS